MTIQRTAAPRRSHRTLIASAAALALAVGLAATTPPQNADAALAGTTPLLNLSQVTLADSAPGCADGDNCVSYPLNLAAKTIFQTQVNAPTAYVSVALVNEFGTEVQSMSVSAQDSDWFNVAVTSDGSSMLGVTPVVSPGKYTLVVASDSQLYFSLFAFSIPDSLKSIKENSTTRGEINERTTRRISGKYDSYSDGVILNGAKNALMTFTFSKPAEPDAQLYLLDSFGNTLVDASGRDSAVISDYRLPYSGLYRLVIQTDTQGKFTLKSSRYTAVKKVSLGSKKSRTLKLNKKKTKTVQLKAVVSPSNATNKKLTWTSSNRKVAKVSRTGKVTALRPGKTTITVKTKDGQKTAKVKITVKRR